MPIHQPCVIKPVTPGPSLDICYWKAEDSGYHTSYTPSLLECSKISGENRLTKSENCLSNQKLIVNRSGRKSDAGFQTPCDCQYAEESPTNRRGVKRLFQERCINEDANQNSLTPTSAIAGKLLRLQFSQEIQSDSRCVKSRDSVYSNLYFNEHKFTSFPSTPIKKKCRSSCKENSLNPNRLLKYDDFAAHSITCERRALQPIRKLVKVFKHKPNKKIDIIQMLYQDQGITPPLMKIFSYLSEQDRKTVKQVSSTWKEIHEVVWETVSKKECHNFNKKSLENIENEEKHIIYVSTPRSYCVNQSKPLIEIQNIQLDVQVNYLSPPTSPSSTRFIRYTKSASLDSREQLPCARCHQPSKLTKENAEEWAQCTSTSCSYQFCKLCLCDRHPGKICIKFDLDGPSPSKRKKKAVAIGTRQSRKNLRRLL